MTKVIATTVPAESALQPWLADSDFHDAYEAPLPLDVATLSPTEIFLHASQVTPPWIDRLMRIRNRVVRLIGLKDVGAMAANAKAADASIRSATGSAFSTFLARRRTSCCSGSTTVTSTCACR